MLEEEDVFTDRERLGTEHARSSCGDLVGVDDDAGQQTPSERSISCRIRAGRSGPAPGEQRTG
jgi:hypothetical protein